MLTAAWINSVIAVLLVIQNSLCVDSHCPSSSSGAYNCSSQNLTEFSPSLLSRKLSEVIVLLLDDNFITSLDPDIFIGMHNLEKLSVARNKLGDLVPGVFDPLNSLRQLHLSGNRLTSIKAGTLDNQENLLSLYLNNNLIHTIEPGAFSGLIRLRELHLQSNALKKLDITMFPKNMYLIVFSMNYNQIQCDCQMRTFYQWLKSRVLMYMAKCDSPGDVSGRFMIDVYDYVIKCPKNVVL